MGRTQIEPGYLRMSFVEKRDNFRPESGEAPFKPNEIFFSHTDDRGVILTGNHLFQKISHYSWDELIGAPHKIIRHDDMPKGIFHLLWETLQSGKPMGAYVKNRTKDNLHYWVFAVVLPYNDGYLSVRIKPTTDKLEMAQNLYEQALEQEKSGDFTPEESAAFIVSEVQKLGFVDYSAFSSRVLAQELSSRDEVMKRPINTSKVRFQQMLDFASDLQSETAGLSQAFEAIGTIPTNLRVIATRLEAAGGAISVLSQNYWAMSQEISGWFNDFVADPRSDFAKIRDTIDECWFLNCTAQILQEAAGEFEKERRQLGSTDVAGEQKNLYHLAVEQTRAANRGMTKIAEEAERIATAITVMRRYISGLSMTRVMCKIESARLPSGGESLSDIIEQLGAFQGTINAQLGSIENLGRSIQSLAQTLINERDEKQVSVTA